MDLIARNQWSIPQHVSDELLTSKLFLMLKRRYKLIAAATGGALVLALLVTLVTPPSYISETTLLVQPDGDRVVSDGESLKQGAKDNSQFQNELELLRSRTIPETIVAMRAAGEKTAAVPELGEGQAQIAAARKAARAREKAVSDLEKAIRIHQIGTSHSIKISARGPSPEAAAKIAGEAATAYFEKRRQLASTSADMASQWLTGRLEQLKQSVDAKENAAQEFRANSFLLADNNSNLDRSKESQTQSTLLMVSAELAEKEAQYSQAAIVARAGVTDTSGVLNSPLLVDLRARGAELARQHADLSSRYGARHPLIEASDQQIRSNKAQTAAETTRILSMLKYDVDVTRRRAQTLENGLAAARGELSGDMSKLARLRALESDVQATRRVYESFMQRLQEVSQQGDLSYNQALVVSAPSLPDNPSSPNLIVNLLAALIAGIGLSGGLIFLLEQSSPTVYGSNDITRLTGERRVTVIPEVTERMTRLLPGSERSPEGFLMENPLSQFSDAIRKTRLAMAYAASGTAIGAHQVVAITSAFSGEGKTTLSLCVGRSMAASGKRVLLIDCDLRVRGLTARLELQPTGGLREVLNRETPWREAVLRDPAAGAADSLHVLAAAIGPSRGVDDPFAYEKFTAFLNEMREHYDLILLDCPPVLVLSEASQVVAAADAYMIIALQGSTPANATKEVVEALSMTGTPLMGFVLNGVNTQGLPYGHARQSKYFVSKYFSDEKNRAA